MLLSRTERELSRTGREVCKEKKDKLLGQKLQHKMIVSIAKCTCEIAKKILIKNTPNNSIESCRKNNIEAVAFHKVESILGKTGEEGNVCLICFFT